MLSWSQGTGRPGPGPDGRRTIVKETLVLMRVALEPVETYVTLPGEFATPEEAVDAARRHLIREGVSDFIGSEGDLGFALDVRDADAAGDTASERVLSVHRT